MGHMGVFYLVLLLCGLAMVCRAQGGLDGSHCSDFTCSALQNGGCFNGVCRCLPGFYDPGTRLCVPRVEAGETCNSSIPYKYQCIDTDIATCRNDTDGLYKCLCVNDTFYVNAGRCQTRIHAGLSCDTSNLDKNQCVNNSLCLHDTNTCECENNFFNDAGVCTPRLDIGATCQLTITDSKQCVDNAHCDQQNINCTCDEGYYTFNQSMCAERKDLNATCDGVNDDDPNQCKDRYAYCQDNPATTTTAPGTATPASAAKTCQCDEHHYIDQDSGSCQKRKTAGVHCNTTVSDPKQCVENSKCTDEGSTSICKCDGNLVFTEGECILTTTHLTTAGEITTQWTPPPPLDFDLIG